MTSSNISIAKRLLADSNARRSLMQTAFLLAFIVLLCIDSGQFMFALKNKLFRTKTMKVLMTLTTVIIIKLGLTLLPF